MSFILKSGQVDVTSNRFVDRVKLSLQGVKKSFESVATSSLILELIMMLKTDLRILPSSIVSPMASISAAGTDLTGLLDLCEDHDSCLLYTSPSPRDQRGSRMPSSA